MFRFLEQFNAPNDEPVDLESFAKHIGEARRLAIYERETGLYAYWYLLFRGEEECGKANRYVWPLALAIFEQKDSANALTMQSALPSWLRLNLRSGDIGAYLGNGRFVVLLPYTDARGAQQIVQRLYSAVTGTVTALSYLPEDGGTFQAVYAAAASRFIDASEAAA